MMSFKLDTRREHCGHCTKQIFIGQSAIICSSCNSIFHKNCARDAIVFRNGIYCPTCVEKFDIIRYNPYFNHHEREIESDKFYDDEPMDYIDIIDDMFSVHHLGKL